MALLSFVDSRSTQKIADFVRRLRRPCTAAEACRFTTCHDRFDVLRLSGIQAALHRIRDLSDETCTVKCKGITQRFPDIEHRSIGLAPRDRVFHDIKNSGWPHDSKGSLPIELVADGKCRGRSGNASHQRGKISRDS